MGLWATHLKKRLQDAPEWAKELNAEKYLKEDKGKAKIEEDIAFVKWSFEQGFRLQGPNLSEALRYAVFSCTESRDYIPIVELILKYHPDFKLDENTLSDALPVERVPKEVIALLLKRVPEGQEGDIIRKQLGVTKQ